MEDAFQVWKHKPTPDNMGALLEKTEPVIQSALKSYAGGNQALHSRARVLAAGAFQNYDPNRGTKLRTYLMTQMQPLTRSSRQYGQMAYVPERVQTDLYHVNQEFQKYFDQYGREPSDQELTGVTGLSMRRIAKVRRFGKGDLSESSLTEFDDGEEAVMYPGVSKVDPEQVWMEYVHHDLSPVDQKILEWKTGYNGKKIISNNEIARRLNLSPGAISQRSAKIQQRLADGQMVR